MDLPTTRHDAAKVAEKPAHAESETAKNHAAGNRLEKASLYVFLATIFLAPLAFIPSTYASLDLVKTVVIALGMFISFLLYGISLLKQKSLRIPHSLLTYSAVGIMVSLIISTFLSTNPWKSFIGQGFEIGTSSFLLGMFVTSFFVACLIGKNRQKTFHVYSALFLAFIVLIVFHIARLIGGAHFMSLGILSGLASTILGKWYDLAIFTGLIGLLSLFGIKFLTLGRNLKIVLSAILVVAGIALFAINFYPVWWSIALITLAFAVYEYFTRIPRGTGSRKFFSRFSLLTVVVIVIAIACAWKGGAIAEPTTTKLGIDQSEIVLPWQMTLDVAANTIKTQPLFGAGPNRFGIQFLKFKPDGINPTQFWTVEFSNGFATVPSFLVTQGIVGAILWLLFLVFFIRAGIISLKKAHEQHNKFFATSTFFAASFLWLMNCIYTPSHVILFFTFVFTGLCFASFANDGTIIYKEFGTNAKSKKYASIILALGMVVLVVWGAVYLKKTVGLAYFQDGIKILNTTNSPDAAEAKFKKALAWDNSDVYYQALSETDILKINTLAQQVQTATAASATKTVDPKSVQQVADLVNEAVGYSRKAIALDPTNYYNYIAEAHISEIASTFKIPNSYQDAKNSYVSAINLNPSDPELYLDVARLDASQNDYTDAEQDLGKALQIKQNYTDAIFLLSQIQVANGQTKDAITSAQVAVQINPSDPTLLFQLGLLEYNVQDYSDAAAALTKAVALSNDYANARYFLGLSDVRLGKNADAIAQFTELKKTNPDSQEVSFILSNLILGKSPFADAQPPIDSQPEKRKTLPINDTSATAQPSAAEAQ